MAKKSRRNRTKPAKQVNAYHILAKLSEQEKVILAKLVEEENDEKIPEKEESVLLNLMAIESENMIRAAGHIGEE